MLEKIKRKVYGANLFGCNKSPIPNRFRFDQVKIGLIIQLEI